MAWAQLNHGGQVHSLNLREKEKVINLLTRAEGIGDLYDEDHKKTGYRIDCQSAYSKNGANIPQGKSLCDGEYSLYAVQKGSQYYASTAIPNGSGMDIMREGLISSLNSNPSQRWVLVEG